MLVVVGILIALSINNWNQTEQQAKREAAVLADLHREFSGNLEEYTAIKQVHTRSLEACDRLMQLLHTPSSDEDSLPLLFVHAFNGATFNPSDGVVESLISSGQIALVSNDSLRKALVSWNDVFADFQEDQAQATRLWTQHIEPYILQHGDFTQINSPRNRALFSDPVFRNMIARKQFYQRGILQAMEQDGVEQSLHAIVAWTAPKP